jgi:hypothetical protein
MTAVAHRSERVALVPIHTVGHNAEDFGMVGALLGEKTWVSVGERRG